MFLDAVGSSNWHETGFAKLTTVYRNPEGIEATRICGSADALQGFSCYIPAQRGKPPISRAVFTKVSETIASSGVKVTLG